MGDASSVPLYPLLVRRYGLVMLMTALLTGYLYVLLMALVKLILLFSFHRVVNLLTGLSDGLLKNALWLNFR